MPMSAVTARRLRLERATRAAYSQTLMDRLNAFANDPSLENRGALGRRLSQYAQQVSSGFIKPNGRKPFGVMGNQPRIKLPRSFAKMLQAVREEQGYA